MLLSVLTTTDIQHRCSRLVCIFPCACAWGSKPLPAPCPPMKVLDPADSQRVLSNPVTLCGSRDTDGDVHAKRPRHWRGSELLWPVFAVCKHCYCAVMNLNPVPGNAIPTETPARIPRPTLRMPPPRTKRETGRSTSMTATSLQGNTTSMCSDESSATRRSVLEHKSTYAHTMETGIVDL